MKTPAGNPRKSSVLNVVLTMMLILFVSLLAFCSGLYLGKQLTDSEYQLKALEGDFGKAGKIAATSKEGEAPADVINDEDIEKMSEKFVSNEKSEENQAAHKTETNAEGRKIASTGEEAEGHEAKAEASHEAKGEASQAAPAAEHGHAAAHEAPAKHETAHSAANASAKPDLSAAHKAAARVANNAAPSETAKNEHESKSESARVPTSLPKTVGVGADVEFTVQVASYPTLEAAKAKSSELQQKGFVSFPVPAQVNGKTWYRVSVGSFKSQKEATSYRAEFLKKTGLTTAIVQKITR